VDELRAPLGEEIEQVRQQLSAADTSPPGAADPAVPRLAAARQALDQAHARLVAMSAPADAQAVTASLADTRYALSAAAALRAGRPVPARTPPCFVDPRHGPSVSTALYPPSGLSVPVPVCAACAAELAAGSQPAARSFVFGGTRMYPWMPYGPAWLYLYGYWGGQPFLNQLTHHGSFVGGAFGHGGHHAPDSGGGHGFGGMTAGGGHHGGGFGGGGLGGGGGGHHGGGGGFGGGGGGHGGGGGGGGHHG
jgi:hypothetical protein